MQAALLALPFGVAIGLSLGLVGGGGSILAVPVLVYVLGVIINAEDGLGRPAPEPSAVPAPEDAVPPVS